MENLEKLSPGVLLVTSMGWIGELIKVDTVSFKHDQGVSIKRIEDGAKFSISPNDVQREATEEDLKKYFSV